MSIHSGFSTAALLGFVGGEQNLGALQVTHVNGRRSLPSAFNAPGSYLTGQGFGRLTASRVWDGPHPGVSVDPTALSSNSSSLNGPKFTAAFSGSALPTTGPIAKLLTEYSRRLAITVLEGRVTTPSAVTVVELPDAPECEVHPTARISAPVILPILVSSAATAACGVAGDLTFTRPVTTPGAPAGDGYLESDNEIVVLKGSEAAVSSITRGQFTLRCKNEGALQAFSTCSVLLTLQCMVQLLVVPRGSFFGQLFFLFTMVVSWLYNAYVARQEKAAWEKLVLEDLLNAPTMKRYSLGTRTQAAVFLMQVLKPSNVEEQLSLLIPNNTPVWKTWRQTVARRLQDSKPIFDGAEVERSSSFNANEMKLLATLFNDAQAAVDAFTKLNGKF
ncbi:hypothetical protein BD309DRAFT_580057 [Dichomitus squalens]|nr:hypothetical protein BD309DRAFT_580057 [Dichomitus squalens]